MSGNKILNKNKICSNPTAKEELNKIDAGIADLLKSTEVDGQACVKIVPRVSQTAYVSVYKGSGYVIIVGILLYTSQQKYEIKL